MGWRNAAPASAVGMTRAGDAHSAAPLDDVDDQHVGSGVGLAGSAGAAPPSPSRTGSPARHLRCQAASLFLLCSMNSISTGSPLPLDALTLPGSSGTRPTRAAIGHAASIGQPDAAHPMRHDSWLMRVRFGILGRLTVSALEPFDTSRGIDERLPRSHSKSYRDSDLPKALISRRSAMSILSVREPVGFGRGRRRYRGRASRRVCGSVHGSGTIRPASMLNSISVPSGCHRKNRSRGSRMIIDSHTRAPS